MPRFIEVVTVCKKRCFKKNAVITIFLLLCVLLSAVTPAMADPAGVKVNISGLTIYLLDIAQWATGISGLIIAFACLKRGLEIAGSAANPSSKVSCGVKMANLVVGSLISFGAWFLVTVIKGVF